MFNPSQITIEAFLRHMLNQFSQAFPTPDPQHLLALKQSASTALETLITCDCAYHDIHHTMLVTDIGQTILRGRQLARGDLEAHEWVNAVVAMLFHDIGYRRGLLKEDTRSSCVVDEQGTRVKLPAGSTDAFLTPHHVTRGRMFVKNRFQNDTVIDVQQVAEYIEMTRFPVPNDSFYRQTDTIGNLVRSADLIGQMADPLYLQKLSRLFAEFAETGEAARLGYTHAGQLRAMFPEFFYEQVHPHVAEGLEFLAKTQEGQQWVANLYHHVHANQDADPKWHKPELVLLTPKG